MKISLPFLANGKKSAGAKKKAGGFSSRKQSAKRASKSDLGHALKDRKRSAAVIAPLPLPKPLEKKLIALRRRRWLAAITQGFSMLFIALCALGLIQCLTDWWFDIPWMARAIFLLFDLSLLAWIYRTYLHEHLRQRVGLPFLALLVEKKWPFLNQTIVSAVQLAEGTSTSTRGSIQLVNVLLQQAQARTTNLNFSEIVPLQVPKRYGLMAATLLVATGAVLVVTFPASLVLIERLLLSQRPLPTRTIVEAVTKDLAVPIGADVTLTARATGQIPRHGRVVLSYADEPAQEYPLNFMPNKPDTFSLTVKNVQKAFKYRFYLNDGHGPEFSVTAEEPPAIETIACRVTYPDYTGMPPEDIPPTNLSILAGSHLHVSVSANQDLKSGVAHLQSTLNLPAIPLTLDSSGRRLEGDITIPAKDVTGFSVQLISRADIPSVNDTVYPIYLVPDHPPVISFISPEDERETIVMSAKPIIAFDATDDFGLTKADFCYQLIPPTENGEVVHPPSQVFHLPFEIKDDKKHLHVEYTLDVATQKPPWKEGWTVNYWIEATDNNTATGPSLTKSPVKQFGVITPDEKNQEILEEVKEAAAHIHDLSTSEGAVSTDLSTSIKK